MLIGQYHTKIDVKGRTALPAKFRRELGEKVVISRWYENSLAIFSEGSWDRVIDLAVGGSLLTEASRDTERFLLGGAYDLELDAQGRMLVPGSLREHAQLKKEVVFIGLKNRVEVWDSQNWGKREKEVTARSGQLIEQVQKSKWN